MVLIGSWYILLYLVLTFEELYFGIFEGVEVVAMRHELNLAAIQFLFHIFFGIYHHVFVFCVTYHLMIKQPIEP